MPRLEQTCLQAQRRSALDIRQKSVPNEREDDGDIIESRAIKSQRQRSGSDTQNIKPKSTWRIQHENLLKSFKLPQRKYKVILQFYILTR